MCNAMNEGHVSDSHHSTANILRIVNDTNCLCYFVQYLDQESALPLIRFWLDVESFKSSTQPCRSRHASVFDAKPPLARSISLGAGHLLNSNESIENDQSAAFDEDMCGDAAICCELPMERDVGDGSSDANSMTNLSDVYERDNDDGIDAISMDANVYEQGRKSATGASSHGDDTDLSEKPQQPNRKSSITKTSTIIDAIHIFKKYLLNGELANLVRIPTEILSRISLALCVQCDTRSTPQQHGDSANLNLSNESIPFAQLEQTNVACVFDDAQAFILNYLNVTYTGGFLESAFFYRFCSENDGENVRIVDILQNEMALFYFMEFMEVEGKRQYVDFWLGAMNFKRQLVPSTSNDNQTSNVSTSIELSQQDALILYDKYFSLQATQPLLMSDQVRFNVEEKICSIDSAASIAHCFDLPLAIVERFLNERYLGIFRMQSQLFGKFMSEVIRKVESAKMKQNNRSALVERKEMRSSISSRNTLLAMENVKKRTTRQRINARISDMCIDSRQIHDPDLLWRRNVTTGLSFGRVNAFGRYERNYDMTPFDRTTSVANNSTGTNSYNSGNANSNDNLDAIIHNTSNTIKRVVRKLVHLPERCMQEELAWQMAEMIVKDVTSVTLNTESECSTNAMH